jgi:hypothetical protein
MGNKKIFKVCKRLAIPQHKPNNKTFLREGLFKNTTNLRNKRIKTAVSKAYIPNDIDEFQYPNEKAKNNEAQAAAKMPILRNISNRKNKNMPKTPKAVLKICIGSIAPPV